MLVATSDSHIAILEQLNEIHETKLSTNDALRDAITAFCLQRIELL